MILEKLINATQDRKVISFNIRGSRCIAEPYAVGIGHNGKMRFSAFQTIGPTRIPGFSWIYESVWALSDLTVSTESFQPRAGQDAADGRFINMLNDEHDT